MSSLSQLLATLDDAAWEALGSKGLLRRAAKDMEKGVACAVLEESPFTLKIQVGENYVTVPREGPARAKCSCGAPGCCHHVIIAGLFCRRAMPTAARATVDASGTEVSSGGGNSPSVALDVLLALDFALLKRWCGAAAWRAGVRFLASGVSAEIQSESSALVVRLNPVAIQCRFLPGADLDGVIVAGGENKSFRTYVTAAVIAVKAHHGQVVPAEDTAETVQAEEKGAPRTRADVLQTTRELLEFALAAGLSHVGPASAERFATLATSAEGTNLPRIARILKTVADELNLLATKHGRADAERALASMAEAYALATALEQAGQKPPAHLVGEHRTGYLDVHSLDLIGITSFPWQARSGFRGVTVLFWDEGQKRWNTWSEARSVTSDLRFDPLVALHGEAPWQANVGVQKLAGSRVGLTSAKRNAVGRLSSTQACKARIVNDAKLGTVDFGGVEFSSWEMLQRQISATTAAGLRTSNPMADWVVIAPSAWHERIFDRVQQRLLWSVADSQDRRAWLVLNYSELTRHGIERLEAWEPPRAGSVRVVGRLLRHTGKLAIEPVALLPGSGCSIPTVHLLVPPESVKSTSPKSAPKVTATSEGDELESDDVENETTHVTDQWLRAARDYLVRKAEVGAANKTGPSQELGALVEQFANAGLPALSRAVSAADPTTEHFSSALLKATYVTRLHEQCFASL